MSFDSGGKGGSDGGKAKKGGFLDGLRSFGADFASAFARNMGASTEQRSTKPSVDRRDPVAVRDRPIAARQIQRRLKIERKAADEEAGKQDAVPQAAEEQLEEEGTGAAAQDRGSASDESDEASVGAEAGGQDAVAPNSGSAAEATDKDGDEEQGAETSEGEAKPSMSVAAKLKGVHRKVFRTANPPAPPGGAQQTTAPKPQAVFDSITVQAPMTGGNEKVQVRPSAPGATGKAELWVANQKGATRFEDIVAGPLGTATNRAGLAAATAARDQIDAMATGVEAIHVTQGKVDEDKLPTLRAKADEAAAIVSSFGQKLRINSLEGANHARKATKKERAEFKKPLGWKKPYINKFVAEMVRQLQQQEMGLNALSLDEWVVNREKFSPTEHLNTLHESAKKAVVDELKERCDEGLPRAQERLNKLQTKKTEMDAAVEALNATGTATPKDMKTAMEKARDAAKGVASVQAEIQGYIDALPEIATGQQGGKMDPSKMKGPGGREDGQTAWANKHRAAKEALFKLIQQNDPLVAEWVGIVKEVGDLAVLHDPDQIAGGHGDIDPLPVVKEPTDPNDTDGREAWREYLTKVKAHLGQKDINGSLGSQWKGEIGKLYTSVTTDADNPQEAYGIRTMNVELVPIEGEE